MKWNSPYFLEELLRSFRESIVLFRVASGLEQAHKPFQSENNDGILAIDKVINE
jgi:hypothetical protein